MATRQKANSTRTPAWVLVNIVEPQRKANRISLRQAATHAGISESNWRQLRDGGVPVNGQWVERTPRRDQVLDMAMAVGCLDDAAKAMGATKDEVQDTLRRIHVPDPAEEEIMASKHLSNTEKLRLIEALHRLRQE